jgi:hypothetical protein
MKPKIWQGVRTVGMQVGGNVVNFGMPGNVVLLDCMKCDQSIKAIFNTERQAWSWSDEKITKLFESYGWTINPTRCPKHAKKNK